MNKYLTFNPLGSTAAKDLYDNASDFDEGLNSPSPSFQGRFNQRLQTWTGLQNLVSDFLVSSGYEATHLTYVNGSPLTVLRPTQLIDHAGSVYRVKQPATFPVTLTGTFATDAALLVDVSDGSLRQALADTVDMSLGAALVGRATYTFSSVTQMKTAKGRYDGDVCVLLGFRTDQAGWGGGVLRWNDTSVSAIGIDGQIFKVAGVPIGCWERMETGSVSIADWGAYNDGNASRVAINNAAFAAARDYVAATLAELVFPDGGYCYTVSPNWAIDRSIITTRGRVDFIYTGTGHAVILDAGPNSAGQPLPGDPGDYVYDMRMGYVTVKVGNAAAQESVYIRSVHHGKLDFNVRSAGAGKAAFKLDFLVCTELNIISSANEDGGWYMGLAPAFGIRLCQRNLGEQVSYCLFPNAIFEHQNTGIQIEEGLGNSFIGGTSEGCVHGMILFAGALRNKVIGMDFEANSTADIECSGNGNEFLHTDTEKAIYIGGLLNKVDGGSHESVIVNAGASSTKLTNFTYNRSTAGGAITDNGTNTRQTDLTDAATGLTHDAPPGTLPITVTGTPFGYGNNTGNNLVVFVIGGTGVSVTITRSGGSANPTGQVSGGFLLTPGDLMAVAFATAPTMYASKI